MSFLSSRLSYKMAALFLNVTFHGGHHCLLLLLRRVDGRGRNRARLKNAKRATLYSFSWKEGGHSFALFTLL